MLSFPFIHAHVSLATFPSPNATDQVKSVLKTLSTKGPQENLKKFSSFRTRRMFLPPPPFELVIDHISDYRSDVKSSSLFQRVRHSNSFTQTGKESQQW